MAEAQEARTEETHSERLPVLQSALMRSKADQAILKSDFEEQNHALEAEAAALRSRLSAAEEELKEEAEARAATEAKLEHAEARATEVANALTFEAETRLGKALKELTEARDKIKELMRLNNSLMLERDEALSTAAASVTPNQPQEQQPNGPSPALSPIRSPRPPVMPGPDESPCSPAPPPPHDLRQPHQDSSRTDDNLPTITSLPPGWTSFARMETSHKDLEAEPQRPKIFAARAIKALKLSSRSRRSRIRRSWRGLRRCLRRLRRCGRSLAY